MTRTAARHGITIPFDGITLAEHRDVFRELVDLGYTDVWSAESGGADAFTPLALAAAWAPTLRLGTAIVPAYTRGATTLACAGRVAVPGRDPGRFARRHRQLVEHHRRALERHPVREAVPARARHAAVPARRRSRREGDRGVRDVLGARLPLGLPVAEQPPILVAALRAGMLRLAGREGDGAIINWLSADDVATVAPIVVGAGRQGDRRPHLRAAHRGPRPRATSSAGARSPQYLNVPVYAAFHEWLGRGDELRPMWDAWQAGDRKAATAAIPASVVDELIVWGPPERIREHIERYCDERCDHAGAGDPRQRANKPSPPHAPSPPQHADSRTHHKVVAPGVPQGCRTDRPGRREHARIGRSSLALDLPRDATVRFPSRAPGARARDDGHGTV